MLTKKMDPPATLHQPSFHHDDDEGYAILDCVLSFNNVHEVGGGREVLGDAVPELTPPAAAATGPKDPTIEDLTVAVPNAAASNEQPSSPSEVSKPITVTSSVKSGPSPLSLRPDDLEDSVLDSINKMNENSPGKHEDEKNAPREISFASPAPALSRPKVTTVNADDDDDDDDDDFTFSSHDPDAPLLDELIAAVDAAEADPAPVDNAASGAAKPSSEEESFTVTAGTLQDPEVVHCEDAKSPAAAEVEGTAIKPCKGTFWSRCSWCKTAFAGAVFLAFGVVGFKHISDEKGLLSCITRLAPSAHPSDFFVHDATIPDAPQVPAEFIPMDAGSDDELLNEGQDVCMEDAGVDELPWGNGAWYKNESHLLAEEDAWYEYESLLLAEDEASYQNGTLWLEEEEALNEDGPHSFAVVRSLPPASMENPSEAYEIHDAGHGKICASSLMHWSAVVDALVPDVLAAVVLAAVVLAAVVYFFATKERRTQLFKRDANQDEEPMPEAARPQAIVKEEPMSEAARRLATFTAEMSRISEALERTGRRTNKENNFGDVDLPKYDVLTLKDLRLILESLFDCVAPAHTRKGKLIKVLTKMYAARLSHLTKSDIQSILKSKGESAPSSLKKDELIDLAVRAGFT